MFECDELSIYRGRDIKIAPKIIITIPTLNQIEEFGENSFKISTVPVLLENVNLQEFFDKILSEIGNKLVICKYDSIKEYLAKSACKTAVKGRDRLSDNEINCLLEGITSEGQVLLCPHGRPIIVEVNKKEIEKWFKRIV